MATKVLLLTGLGATSTEDGVREWMRGFGPVRHVEFVRDGNPAAPVAVVEMEISEAQAFFIVSRISDYWHEGSLVSARLMVH
jgi:hypothetical protein